MRMSVAFVCLALLVAVSSASQAQEASPSAHSAIRAAQEAYWDTCMKKRGVCGVADGLSPPDKTAGFPSQRDGSILSFMLDRGTNQIVTRDPLKRSA